MTLLSIGIVTWNSSKYIELCLECLKNQKYQEFELIIVDNNSSDSTVSIAQNLFPNAIIIINNENMGFCGGHNQAISLSTGEYYMPYNPDIFAEPEFLGNMMESINNVDKKIGSVSGKLLRFDPEINEKTNIIDSTGIFFKKNRRSLDRGAESLDAGQYDKKEFVFGASGAAPLYKRAMLEDIKVDGQYFFENFFAYREDVDLAWRAQLRGWKCIYNFEAVAYHVRNNTPEKRDQMSQFVNMHSVKNRLMMIIQNESFLGLIKDGWKFVIYDLLIIAYVLLKERTSLPGLNYIVKNVSLIFNRRKSIRKSALIRNKDILEWFGRIDSRPINNMEQSKIKQHVFIIGSKGIPAKYGGFETFVDQLTAYRQQEIIQYHISCLADNENEKEFIYNNARCFQVDVPHTGSSRALFYDILSMISVIKYIKKYRLTDAKIYILACRIGPVYSFLQYFSRKYNPLFFVNPDGHEWKRSKWNKWIRAYWKLSEKYMIKNSDLIICDSIGIEEYIKSEYKNFNPTTKYISYGTHIRKSKLSDDSLELNDWYKHHGIESSEYYLIVGRFVPENNYETMIKGFMESRSTKNLVIITNVEKNSYYSDLLEKTNFINDKRIKWVGTVYNKELLMKIRENAYAYLHGHEVGGTNPSLLESMGSTKINLLLNVVFNKEVGQSAALYFEKDPNYLASLIETADSMGKEEIDELHHKALNRMSSSYSWDSIINDYERTFVENRKEIKPSLSYTNTKQNTILSK